MELEAKEAAVFFWSFMVGVGTGELGIEDIQWFFMYPLADGDKLISLALIYPTPSEWSLASVFIILPDLPAL